MPLDDLAVWSAGFAADLVVEFVGHSDRMVEKLLRNREGQDLPGSHDALAGTLAQYFTTVTHEPLQSGVNKLYYGQVPYSLGLDSWRDG